MQLKSPLPRAPEFVSPTRDDECFRLFEIDSEYSGCSWHFHPEFQLGYVVSGVGERMIGDCLVAIEPGEIVLLGPNLPHVWRYDSTSLHQPVEAIAIHFRENFLGSEFMNKPEMRDLRLLLSRASQGLQVVGQTRTNLVPQVELLRRQTGFERLLNLLSILNVIAKSREVLTLCSPVFQPVQAELELGRLQRVFDFVKTHFDQSIDRDRAADLAHMSPSAFSRFFKSRTGVTFQDFVTDVRVGQACRLLLHPELSITTVAVNCGFVELSTFNRAFRRLRNMSPGEYRARMERLSRMG